MGATKLSGRIFKRFAVMTEESKPEKSKREPKPKVCKRGGLWIDTACFDDSENIKSHEGSKSHEKDSEEGRESHREEKNQ
jgi:hypothetical protein